jgi:hypothetical protein
VYVYISSDPPAPCDFAVIVDLRQASLANIDYALIKRLIHILTDFYPEVLSLLALLVQK